MVWPLFALFAYVMLGLQIGIAPYVLIGQASPNLGLIVVIFTALYARRQDYALLGCFCIGLTQDLLTGGQPGLYAIAYGFVALFARGASEFFSRTNPLAQIGLALAGGIITMLVLVVHGWIHPPAAPPMAGKTVLPAVHMSIRVELVRVIYSAALAPIFLLLLQRIRGLFVFQPGRRRR